MYSRPVIRKRNGRDAYMKTRKKGLHVLLNKKKIMYGCSVIRKRNDAAAYVKTRKKAPYMFLDKRKNNVWLSCKKKEK